MRNNISGAFRFRLVWLNPSVETDLLAMMWIERINEINRILLLYMMNMH